MHRSFCMGYGKGKSFFVVILHNNSLDPAAVKLEVF